MCMCVGGCVNWGRWGLEGGPAWWVRGGMSEEGVLEDGSGGPGGGWWWGGVGQVWGVRSGGRTGHGEGLEGR